MSDYNHDGDRPADMRPWMDLRGRIIDTSDWGHFERRSLVGADLRGAQIRSLSTTDLSLANLSGAYFIGGHYEWIYGQEASFRGASLARCNLWHAKFFRCDFSGAIFDGATLSGVAAVECNFTGARFQDTSFGGADPTGAIEGPVDFCNRHRIGRMDQPEPSAGDFDESEQAEHFFLRKCDFSGSMGLPDMLQDQDRDPE